MSFPLEHLAQEIERKESSGLIECLGPPGSGRIKFLRSLLPTRQASSGRIAWIESRLAVGPGLLRWLTEQSLEDAACFELRQDLVSGVLEVLRSRLFRFVFLNQEGSSSFQDEVAWLRVRQTAKQVGAWVFVLSIPSTAQKSGLHWMWNYRFQVQSQDQQGVHLEILRGPNKGECVCIPLHGWPLVPVQS
jgi:hypothetical protein